MLTDYEDLIEKIDDEYIRKFSGDPRIIRFIRKRFKRLNRTNGSQLVKLILNGKVRIKVEDFTSKKKTFLKYNKKRICDNEEIEKEYIISIHRELKGLLIDLGVDFKVDDEIEMRDDEIYYLAKHHTYEQARKLLCDEAGMLDLNYNFKKPDLELEHPKNITTLQRCKIQILEKSVKFDYPVIYKYNCPLCYGFTEKKAYETASSSNNRISCQNIHDYLSPEGEPKSKICRTTMIPDDGISLTKDAYFYNIGYESANGDKHSAYAISFNDYTSGFYDCVMFRVNNPKKTELYHIVDIRETKNNEFKIPELIDDENYLLTLVREFDNYIEQQTEKRIAGLLPIKIAFVIQKLFNSLDIKLICNIMLVGNKSTGKSFISEYYGYLLNSHQNLCCDGLSVSIPSLRGTPTNVSLMGKDQKIITTGYLGSYHTICVDEANQNREFVEQLKSFLLKNNYGYFKAGAEGLSRKRTTHVNISENLNIEHVGKYRAMVRKRYRKISESTDEETPDTWNEEWNLHQPLYAYTNNIFLYKAIKVVREEFEQKQTSWLDGYELALHDRFPLYFYLVNNNDGFKTKDIVKENLGNDINDELTLINKLYSKNIQKFFKSLSAYKVKTEADMKAFEKVDELLEVYKVPTDMRSDEFFYFIIWIIRIVNQRDYYRDSDFEIFKYLLQSINQKVDISDLMQFKINPLPDEVTIKELLETNTDDDEFSMPDDEFE